MSMSVHEQRQEWLEQRDIRDVGREVDGDRPTLHRTEIHVGDVRRGDDRPVLEWPHRLLNIEQGRSGGALGKRQISVEAFQCEFGQVRLFCLMDSPQRRRGYRGCCASSHSIRSGHYELSEPPRLPRDQIGAPPWATVFSMMCRAGFDLYTWFSLQQARSRLSAPISSATTWQNNGCDSLSGTSMVCDRSTTA